MSRLRVLLLDNHDSFTFNLAQYLGELGAAVEVVLSDRIATADVNRARCDALVISPGPGRPETAGISVSVVQERAAELPMLGVCLGHQAIVCAFGGALERAKELVHGKTSPVSHDGRGVFAGLENPFDATRYHSLAVASTSLPQALEACAHAPDGTILGVRHKTLRLHGVQFHPESILTLAGKRLLANFLDLASAMTGVGA